MGGASCPLNTCNVPREPQIRADVASTAPLSATDDSCLMGAKDCLPLKKPCTCGARPCRVRKALRAQPHLTDGVLRPGESLRYDLFIFSLPSSPFPVPYQPSTPPPPSVCQFWSPRKAQSRQKHQAPFLAFGSAQQTKWCQWLGWGEGRDRLRAQIHGHISTCP